MGKETETKERRILNGTGHEKRTRERPEVCPVAKKCGGCQMQGVPYEKQLEKKRALVRACVEHVKVHPVIGMDNPLHYRNKVHAVFGRDRRDRKSVV